MNLKRVIRIYDIIKEYLPKSYPRPRLAFFENQDHLIKAQNMRMAGATLFATYDPEIDTINLPIQETLKMSDTDIAKILFHEMYHAYAGKKYGYSSKLYSDEEACDRFARKWTIKIGDHLQQDNPRFRGWREQEIEYLKNFYSDRDKERIVNDIGRTWGAIKTQASKLGLRRKT